MMYISPSLLCQLVQVSDMQYVKFLRLTPFQQSPTENGDRDFYPGLPSNMYVPYLCHHVSLTNVSTQCYLSISSRIMTTYCHQQLRRKTENLNAGSPSESVLRLSICVCRISVGAPTPEILTGSAGRAKGCHGTFEPRSDDRARFGGFVVS